MRTLDVLFSPTVRCSLRCKYCFVDQTAGGAPQDMSIDDCCLAMSWLRRYADVVKAEKLRITWFGGEPLLLGTSLLEKTLDFQTKLFCDGPAVRNVIQTNFTIANADVVRLMKKYFGSSISGSLDYGSDCRVFPDGTSSRALVERNIRYFQKEGLDVGVVCTLVRPIPTPESLYRYFKDLSVTFRVNRASLPNSNQVDGGFLSVAEYEAFMTRLFDCCISDPNPTVQCMNLTMMARMYLGGKCVNCVDLENPELFVGIEPGGRIRSRCRFLDVVGKWTDATPEEIRNLFREMASPPVFPGECKSCPYAGTVCPGGCVGEKHCSCMESKCGFRTETTRGLWNYVASFLGNNDLDFGSMRDK